jgi:hypothetical protein
MAKVMMLGKGGASRVGGAGPVRRIDREAGEALMAALSAGTVPPDLAAAVAGRFQPVCEPGDEQDVAEAPVLRPAASRAA